MAPGPQTGRGSETNHPTSLVGRVIEDVRPLRWARDLWRRVRAWRRIRFTSGGLVFTLGAVAVGLAAMNTGNNLLYLLLGSMLGFIAVSGWLSEKAISGLRITRRLPRAVTVGQPMRIGYDVRNAKRFLPTMAVELSERGLPERAFLSHVKAGGDALTRSTNSFVRRGIYPLGALTLSTSFPFGMFLKERDIELPGEVVVWPRTDRPVRRPMSGGGRVPRGDVSARGAAGTRGEYRSLRNYRAGDDPRDIHWKSSARLRAPVIREYERDGAQTQWICLDTRGGPGDPAEIAVEIAAALAARALRESRPFALVAGDVLVDPGEGPGQLERVLDVLARADFSALGSLPTPPVDRAMCVVVSIDGAFGFGDAITVGRHARFDPEELEAA